jgi:hypothetical protein
VLRDTSKNAFSISSMAITLDRLHQQFSSIKQKTTGNLDVPHEQLDVNSFELR